MLLFHTVNYVVGLLSLKSFHKILTFYFELIADPHAVLRIIRRDPMYPLPVSNMQ